MSVRRAGFFRELRHGDPGGPSLVESSRREPPADKESVVRYLEGGHTVAATGVLVDDALDSSRTAVAPLELVTDGAWIWPRDLAYYVRRYNVSLPDDFVTDMRRRSWQPPMLTDDELMSVAARVRDE
jgi:hypothetical protein